MHVSRASLQKLEFEFFVKKLKVKLFVQLLCLPVHAAVACIATAGHLTDSRKSIAGRRAIHAWTVGRRLGVHVSRAMPNWTDASRLGTHVGRASVQKFEFKNSVK